MLRPARIFLFLLLLASPVHAQDYLTRSWVYLRRSPSMTGDRLRALQPGDSLRARAHAPVPGWTPVRTMDGKAGWVGEVYLLSLAALLTPALLADAGGTAFAALDSAWAKPAVVTSSIWLTSLSCGATGDAADDDGTNLHKNRNDVPDSTHFITVGAIRALPDTALWRFTNRKNWTRADSLLVLPWEGIPVTVEGFFEIVKPQAGGSGESPNCHAGAEADTDWHVALIADSTETEDRSVVVEPTPRTKRNNPGWIVDSIKRLAVRRTPSSARDETHAARVRVSGFLMLDPVHPAHIAGHCTSNCAGKHFYRATLWEVHPVTRIEVLRNGQWVNLGPGVP